jgi:hypothetical protein
MPIIDLVYFNAGGGHRAAAHALETVIREQGRPWEVRRINLMEVLDPKDIFGKTLGVKPEDLYNTRLKRGWSLGLAQELVFLQALIRLAHPAMTARLRRHWRRTKPDMVVSLIPNFNRAMYAALTTARPGAPYVTILTDFADLPPHFWIEPRQAQHFICGTRKAVMQAYQMGYGPAQVHATSGMIVRPDFYREAHREAPSGRAPVATQDLGPDPGAARATMNFEAGRRPVAAQDLDPGPGGEPATTNFEDGRRAASAKLNLDPDRPTGIVLFGGHGSKTMQSIARRLDRTQLIFICGHNAALTARLKAMPTRAPRLVLGFTPWIRDFMQASDFFIGKPGPGCISEAIQQGLPVIVVKNTWTMPQERYNADWIAEQRAGIVLDSFKSVRSGVAEMIENLPQFRASVARIQNRAVFEIPEILERILREGRPGTVHHAARPVARYSEPTAVL